MAVDGSQDPLERATQAIREEDAPEWVEVAQTIKSRVRSVVRPAATLTAFDPQGTATHGSRGSTLHVSERVLTPRLRAVIDTSTRAADSVDVTVTEDRCSTIRIGLVCTYGSDLQTEGAEVRAAVAEVLTALLGPDPAFDPERDVEIRIVDVVEGDPHRA